MRVVDFHVHIGLREHWHPWVNDYMRRVNPFLYENFDEIMSPEGLVSYLRGEGLDRAVILAENSPETTGVVTNDFVAEFCRGEEFYIPFASIHPREDEEPVRELERCVQDLGFMGLKMYPTYHHYFPNNEDLYPVYEKAVDLDIPVMFHTGSSIFKGARLKYGEPKYLDDVAVDFPKLDIVMAHSGRGAWYDQASLLTRIHDNVYMEISGLPPRNLLTYFPKIGKVIDKVIFGSDWPGLPSISDNIADIEDLGFDQNEVAKILGRNSAALLDLD